MFRRLKTQSNEALLTEYQEAQEAIKKTTHTTVGQKMLRELMKAIKNELKTRNVCIS